MSSIPRPAPNPESLHTSVLGIIEILETREGARGREGERLVTRADLSAWGVGREGRPAFTWAGATALAMARRGAADPDFSQLADDGSGSTGAYGYSFASGAHKELFFEVVIPFSYQEGGQVWPVCVWAPSSAAAGAAIWGLELCWTGRGAAVLQTTTVTRASQAGGAANTVQWAVFDALAAGGKTAGSVISARVFRDGVNDAYGAAAWLLAAGFVIPVDSQGFTSPVVKR